MRRVMLGAALVALVTACGGTPAKPAGASRDGSPASQRQSTGGVATAGSSDANTIRLGDETFRLTQTSCSRLGGPHDPVKTFGERGTYFDYGYVPWEVFSGKFSLSPSSGGSAVTGDLEYKEDPDIPGWHAGDVIPPGTARVASVYVLIPNTFEFEGKVKIPPSEIVSGPIVRVGKGFGGKFGTSGQDMQWSMNADCVDSP